MAIGIRRPLLGLFEIRMLRKRLNADRAALKGISLWVSLALVALFGNSAVAGQITTLFNTGVDASRTPLNTQTDGAHGIADSHYSLVAVPVGGTTISEVYNYDQWLPVNSTSVSAWLAPNQYGLGYGTNDVGPAGVYDYRTTFNLTGFNPLTALISGQWAADNQGTDIVINGHSTGQQTTLDTFFRGFTPFSISNQFLNAGSNTLDFIVTNSPGTQGYDKNPTGVRVEFLSATADSVATSAVPEPSAFIMVSVLFGAFAMVSSGRRLQRFMATA